MRSHSSTHLELSVSGALAALWRGLMGWSALVLLFLIGAETTLHQESLLYAPLCGSLIRGTAWCNLSFLHSAPGLTRLLLAILSHPTMTVLSTIAVCLAPIATISGRGVALHRAMYLASLPLAILVWRTIVETIRVMVLQ